MDLKPTTVFPNFPPGGHIDDENNQKAIEALHNAKEYSIVNEEDILQQESILSKYTYTHTQHMCDTRMYNIVNI